MGMNVESFTQFYKKMFKNKKSEDEPCKHYAKGASHKRLHIVGSHLYEIFRIGKLVQSVSRLVNVQGLLGGQVEEMGIDC